jgi:catechol 2,3-dioxygenase-like lactoylglutathione lyase family enzyme
MSPQLAVFGIVVSDMARSVAFYRRLGLEFPEGAENQPHVEAPLPGGLRYALDTEEVMRSFDPGWTRPTGGHMTGGAFRCEAPAEVDRIFGELLEAGARPHKEPWDAFWGERYAQVEDPDGTVIDLYAPLPEAGSAPGAP